MRIYGTPTAKAAAILKGREEFTIALRSNDTKALGYSTTDEDDSGSFDLNSILPGIETSRFRGFSDYLQAGTKKVWATNRACDVVAGVVQSTDLSMAFRDPAKNDGRAKVKVDPDLLRLLQNPNPYETMAEMLYVWVFHMKLCGNAFWFKDEMNALGQPRHIYWLNPRFMRIIPDKETRIAAYRYSVNGTDILFTPDEIIHFKRPNANDPIWGLGEIEASESLYNEFINRTLLNTRQTANGGFPTSILTREDFDGDPDEWELNRAKFIERYGGVKNAGKTAWLNGKWSLLQLGIDAQKMQELEKSKQNVVEIFLNHGVPLSVVGYGSSNFATARQEDISFRRYTCKPLLSWFVDVMNSERGFITAFSKEHKLTFQLSGLVDVEQVMKDMGPLFDRAGCSPNDLRVACGFTKVNDPLMDARYVLSGYVPLELAGIVTQEPSAEPAAGGKPKPKPGSDQNTNDGEATRKAA